MKIAVTIYFLLAIAFGSWSDAMDKRYGINGGASSSWVGATSAAVVWPLALPTCLAMMALAENGGRWKLARS